MRSLLLILVLAGCGEFSLDTPLGPISVDDPALADAPGIIGVPNIDDDDENGVEDWDDAEDGGDNDIVGLTLYPHRKPLTLSVSGDDEFIRIWMDDDIVLDEDEDSLELSKDDGEAITLGIEFGDYLAKGILTISDGKNSLEILLTSSPLITNHHLQPAEYIWVLEYTGWGGNGAMLDVFEAQLGDRFIPVSGSDYGWDLWVEDEFEFASANGTDGHRLDTVIDSIRDRGLDDMPEDMLVEPDVALRIWGNPNQVTTYDSFGNLEASPPVTVDGVTYPFGRVYYGAVGDYHRPDEELTEMFASQYIQSPVEIDTSWLCVGHIDEFTSFIPDPSSEKGFKFLFADTVAGYELIDSMDGNLYLSQYASQQNGHGIETISEMRDDQGIRYYNEDIQANYLDPVLEVFISNFGLEEDDIILVPALFEEVSNCGAAALIPGTVNLAVANMEGEPVKLFIPDPYLRENTNDQSSDAFIALIEELFPSDIELFFVDDWLYHMGLGEVHCGSNTQRTPIVNWWDYPELLGDF